MKIKQKLTVCMSCFDPLFLGKTTKYANARIVGHSWSFELRISIDNFVYLHTIQLTITTQVGSPAVRLRLARCTSWVKRWSKAMDFLETTYFQTKHLLIVHQTNFGFNFKTPEIHANI